MSNQLKQHTKRLKRWGGGIALGFIIIFVGRHQAVNGANPTRTSSCIAVDSGIPLVKHNHWPEYEGAFMHDLFSRTACPNEKWFQPFSEGEHDNE